ncbi:MAG: phosphate ABC transporter permease PstA [Pseudomonadota bacterium]
MSDIQDIGSPTPRAAPKSGDQRGSEMPQTASQYYASTLFDRRLKLRRSREWLLRILGVGSIALAMVMLLTLFGSILWQSRTAFIQTQISLPVHFDTTFLAKDGTVTEANIRAADYRSLIRNALIERLGKASGRTARREQIAIVSGQTAFRLREMVLADPLLIGTKTEVWVPASDDVHNIMQGAVSRDVSEDNRTVSDRQLAWLDQLSDAGQVRAPFAWDLLFENDSRDPEVAGIFAGVMGSMLMLFVTLAVSLPLGVAAAVYLEEFAPRNWFTELIDVNIRNLAAVPSIVFGLLALAVFIRVFGMPRSSPLVGGLALSLLVLPTMIIAARAAIEAVPQSLRNAALELGASRMQTVTLVVLPNALPGILTGTIISMAEALGETAPLLMIGMIAFVADTPTGLLDPAAPLPVQIYTWSTSPERLFAAKTAAAIIVLLMVLFLMNAVAIYVRDRLQKKW